MDFSLDGSHVAFETNGALVPEDRDFTQDVYEHSGGVTRIVSVGDLAGSGVFNAYLGDVSEDGTKIFFSTAETLVAADEDRGNRDVLERSGGNTELISTGPQGDGDHDATFNDASADGSRVVFTTGETLLAEDTDTAADVYERASGATTLVSTGPVDGAGGIDATFNAAARHGGRVVFHSFEQLVPEDSDTTPDLYARTAGTTTLVSTGPTDDGGGVWPTFKRASEDASVVLFTTNEQLVAEHTPGQTGYYRRSGSQTDLIVMYPASNLTSAPFVLSGDGSHVFFTTKSAHVPEDVDDDADIYGWHGGTTELVSTGPGDTHTAFARTPVPSFDGERVFFQSSEPLIPGDADGFHEDLFERFGGTTTQVSPPGGGISDTVAAVNPAGDQLLVSSIRPLVSADTDGNRADLYLFTSSAGMSFMPAFLSNAQTASPTPPAESQTQAAALTVSPSTGNGKLAMEIVDQGRRIATVEPDGTGFSYVTGADPNSGGPAWSPDGSRLGFWSGNSTEQNSRIGTVEPDGENRTWMSESSQSFGASYPAWSPDGQTIAFLWRPAPFSSCAGIATTRVDGTESKIVVPPGLPCDKRELAWSPHGDTFLVSALEPGQAAEIYSIRPDEIEATRLTDETGPARTRTGPPTGRRSPTRAMPSCGWTPTDRTAPSWPTVLRRRGRPIEPSWPTWAAARSRSNPCSLTRPAAGRSSPRRPRSATSTGSRFPAGRRATRVPRAPRRCSSRWCRLIRQCGAPNRTHGPPLSSPSCNPPVQSSDHLTVGTADSNGQPTSLKSSLQLETLTGNPSTPADEADVAITSVPGRTLPRGDRAVRRRRALRLHGPAAGPLPGPLDRPPEPARTCHHHPGPDAGRADRVRRHAFVPGRLGLHGCHDPRRIVPGAVPEGKRSNWQLDQVMVFDGGSDGDPATGPPRGRSEHVVRRSGRLRSLAAALRGTPAASSRGGAASRARPLPARSRRRAGRSPA